MDEMSYKSYHDYQPMINYLALSVNQSRPKASAFAAESGWDREASELGSGAWQAI